MKRRQFIDWHINETDLDATTRYKVLNGCRHRLFHFRARLTEVVLKNDQLIRAGTIERNQIVISAKDRFYRFGKQQSQTQRPESASLRNVHLCRLCMDKIVPCQPPPASVL